MKNNKQHTIKKSYSKPVIEEVMIDREISIAMTSTPPGEGPPGGEFDPDGVGASYKKELPTYERAKFSSPSPFKGAPDY